MSYKILIHGLKGTGKTTAALSVAGDRAVHIGLGAEFDPPSWTEWRALVTEAVKAKAVPVIEDLELAFQLCRKHILGNDYRDESDGEKGLLWELGRKEWEGAIRLLATNSFIGMCQSDWREITTVHRAYHRLTPALTARGYNQLKPHLTHILVADYQTGEEGTERIIRVQGDESYDSASPTGSSPSAYILPEGIQSYIQESNQ